MLPLVLYEYTYANIFFTSLKYKKTFIGIFKYLRKISNNEY